MKENKENTELEIGGFAFGLTSGIITTLGLIVGIDSATNSRLAVIAAILTVSVADSLSDAMGIHLSEESRKDESNKPIWTISIFSFFSKLFFSLIFLAPILLLDLSTAIKASIVLGLTLIAILAFYVAKRKSESIIKQIFKHVFLAVVVIVISYYLGLLADYLT